MTQLMKIERKYKIKFPVELKKLYKEALPISKGFYNWREALTDENTDKFEKVTVTYKRSGGKITISNS